MKNERETGQAAPESTLVASTTGRDTASTTPREIEFHHRLRNAMAAIRAIARLTADTSDSIEAYTMKFDGRLAALSRVLLMSSRNELLGVDLEYLVAEELLVGHAQEGNQVSLSGPPISLRAKAAETIGLAIHEMTTNAIEHGSLGHSAGKLAVTWRIADGADGKILVIDWVEVGPSRLVAVPSRRGFGLTLLQDTLDFEFGAPAQLSFTSPGFRCRIELPFNAVVHASGDN